MTILRDHPETKERIARDQRRSRRARRGHAAARCRRTGPPSSGSAGRPMARRRIADAADLAACRLGAALRVLLAGRDACCRSSSCAPACSKSSRRSRPSAARWSFAVFGIVLAFGAFVVIWREGIARRRLRVQRRWRSALALLAYPAYLGTRAYTLPMINDITTDPINPPRFDVLARLRPRGTVDYAGLYAAEQQRQAYPDIEPLAVTATPQVAYDATLVGHHQAQVARGGRARRRRPAGATARSRRWRARRSWASATTSRCASAPTHDGARDRRALGLALRPPRPRRQRVAHPQPAGRHRRADRRRAPTSRSASAGAGSRQAGAGQASAGEAVAARDRGRRRRSRPRRATPGPRDAPAPTCRRRASAADRG